jgi:hypothetical protein
MVSSLGEDSGGTANISRERLKLSRRGRRDIEEKRWNNYDCSRMTWKTGYDSLQRKWYVQRTYSGRTHE